MKRRLAPGVAALCLLAAAASLPASAATTEVPTEATKLFGVVDYAAGFGNDVAIFGDRALVGAPRGDITSATQNSGLAYLYDSTSGGLVRRLAPRDLDTSDAFGFSVALSETYAVVGARGQDSIRWSEGAVYVFDAATGAQVHKLIGSDAAANEKLGMSVDISGDIIVAGARGDITSIPGSGVAYGSVYVFDAGSGEQIAKLISSDTGLSDWFGSAVAISGTTAIVGAFGDQHSGEKSGAAYLFNTATGEQIAKLVPEDIAAGDYFGLTVDISGDVAIVGAHRNTGAASQSGAAYLFDARTGEQLAKLTDTTDVQDGFFGFDVAIAGDVAMVSAVVDSALGPDVSTVSFFDVTTGALIQKIVTPSDTRLDSYGAALDLYGDAFIIGAPADQELGLSPDAPRTGSYGAAYLYPGGTLDLTVTPVPAPAAFWLLGAAAAMMCMMRRSAR